MADNCEGYVRARWDGACFTPPHGPCGFISAAEASLSHWSQSEPEAWRAAYAFTLEREEQIRLKREEIEHLRFADFSGPDAEVDGIAENAQDRILALLESQLQELLKGFKEVTRG